MMKKDEPIARLADADEKTTESVWLSITRYNGRGVEALREDTPEDAPITLDLVRETLGLKRRDEFLESIGKCRGDHRSGRTTEVMLHAAVEVLNGNPVTLIGHTQEHGEALARAVTDIAECVLGKSGPFDIKGVGPSGSDGNRCNFVDHGVRITRSGCV